MSKPRPMADPFPALLADLRITTWDAVLFTDGSGGGPLGGIGWACSVCCKDGRRQLVYGGQTPGTVNTAELAALAWGLSWYDQFVAGDTRRVTGRPAVVHFVSDSQCVVNQSQKQTGTQPVHRALWAMIKDGLRRGIELHGHWRERDWSALHVLVDHVSRQSRIAVEGLSESRLFGDPPARLCDLNPQAGAPRPG